MTNRNRSRHGRRWILPILSVLTLATVASSQAGSFTTAPRSVAISELHKYGIVAFSRALLHNHSGLAGDSFLVQGAIFANEQVRVGHFLTIDRTIVAAGSVRIDDGASVEQDVFANAVRNDGTIHGRVELLAAVSESPWTAEKWELTDHFGHKHRWYPEPRVPGSYDGDGFVADKPSEYTVRSGETFEYSIFELDGTPVEDPDLNVIHYIAPPALDYVAMKEEAERNDDTYFQSQAQAISYLIAHKVDETIEGKTVTTIRVGSEGAPEFLYIDDDFDLTLVDEGRDDVIGGVIDADAFHLEGGIYVSGSFKFEPTEVPPGTYPSDYYALQVNALPYCYPAIITYPQPCGVGCRFDRHWQPQDTPAMTGSRSRFAFGPSNSIDAELALLRGMVFAEADLHLHASSSDRARWVRVDGSLIAFTVHVCDFFELRHDEAITCTRFIHARAADISPD